MDREMAVVDGLAETKEWPGAASAAMAAKAVSAENNVERLTIQPRPDWQAKVEALGLNYHTTASEPYWDESVCYRFTAAEIDRIEAATNELHRICIEAAGHVIDRKLYAQFGIPQQFVPLIENSWNREDLSLHGRFDLRYDGAGNPKMYEYNADTPTSLLEASVAQWYWLEDVLPKADQFNSIHEKLIARWKEGGVKGPVHFACAGDHAEDAANTRYMQDVAAQAGLETKILTMSQIGWDGRRFVDLERQRITTLYKLYPWEWMMTEQFGKYLPQEPWKVVEPAWKMILSSKAILPVLWELFPGHANLLPAFFSPGPLGNSYVRKPMRGREGANVLLRTPGREIETDGEYADEGFVYQQVCLPPEIDGHFPVIGSWIARDEAAGIGVRESDSPITQNTSRFVPHYFA
jgi:glutathionylspermidine synthase